MVCVKLFILDLKILIRIKFHSRDCDTIRLGSLSARHAVGSKVGSISSWFKGYLNVQLVQRLPQRAVGSKVGSTCSWFKGWLNMQLVQRLAQHAVGSKVGSTCSWCKGWLNKQLVQRLAQQAVGSKVGSTSSWFKGWLSKQLVQRLAQQAVDAKVGSTSSWFKGWLNKQLGQQLTEQLVASFSDLSWVRCAWVVMHLTHCHAHALSCSRTVMLMLGHWHSHGQEFSNTCNGRTLIWQGMVQVINNQDCIQIIFFYKLIKKRIYHLKLYHICTYRIIYSINNIHSIIYIV